MLFRDCLHVISKPNNILLDVKWVKYFIRSNARNTSPACYKGLTLSSKGVEKPVLFRATFEHMLKSVRVVIELCKVKSAFKKTLGSLFGSVCLQQVCTTQMRGVTVLKHRLIPSLKLIPPTSLLSQERGLQGYITRFLILNFKGLIFHLYPISL